MAITAKVLAVNRVGDRVAIQCAFSDGMSKEYTFDLPLNMQEARAMVKQDIDRMNTIDGQINVLKSLIGVEIK